MRLTQVNIDRYGPLSSVVLRFGEGVHAVFGPNESGKTLIIDALLKKLTGRGVGWHASLDRVEETPEGFIVLEDDGEEIKLEKGETLADYLDIEPEELRNVFVVRDADLIIREEDVFYRGVADRITGLRFEDIRKIQERLRQLGRLTTTNKISKAAGHHNAASKLKDAQRLKKEVSNYLDKAKEEGILQLEADIFEAEADRKRLKEQVELLKKAKIKKEYLKLERTAEESQANLEELEKIPEEEEISSLGRDLEEVKENESRRPHIERTLSLTKNLTYLALIASSASFVVSVLTGFTGLENLVIPILLLVGSMVSSVWWRRASSHLSDIETSRNGLLERGWTLGLEANSIASMKKGVSQVREKRRALEQSLQQKIGVLKDALGIDIDSSKEALEKADEKLREKKESIELDVEIEFSQDKLDKAEKDLEGADKKLRELGKRLTDHRSELSGFSERALKLDFQAFLGRDLDLNVENLESLKELISHLEQLADKIEFDAGLSRTALEIFKEMASEEEAKITELFGKNSLASKIFSETTLGRYGEVTYDPETHQILVRRQVGLTMPAEKLSRGARDQLYLSIRVALGRKLLEGRNGFFIMDDAFLASDRERLKRQVDMIRKLSDSGWQTVYFTTKEDTIEALRQITDNEPIRLQQLF